MHAKPPLEQIVPDPNFTMSQDFNALAGSSKDLEQFTCSKTPAHTTENFLPPTQPHLYPPQHPVGWPIGAFHRTSSVNERMSLFLTYTRLPHFTHKLNKILTWFCLPRVWTRTAFMKGKNTVATSASRWRWEGWVSSPCPFSSAKVLRALPWGHFPFSSLK